MRDTVDELWEQWENTCGSMGQKRGRKNCEMGLFHVWYAHTDVMLRDICLLQYGEQECDSGYGYGPCIRNFYFIHYVYSGRGHLVIEGKRYEIAAGQYFLICPGQIAYYEADTEEPWVYRWFEISGELCKRLMKLAGFSETCPVLTDGEHRVGDAVLALIRSENAEFTVLLGRLWEALHAMTAGHADSAGEVEREDYVRKCEAYIRMNLHKKLRVTELAEYAGIDRSYLSWLFRTRKGQSPQQYILKLKMEAAAQHLKKKELSVKEVALCVGYDDPLEFSKQFHRQFQVSPTRWRKKAFYEQSIQEFVE